MTQFLKSDLPIRVWRILLFRCVSASFYYPNSSRRASILIIRLPLISYIFLHPSKNLSWASQICLFCFSLLTYLLKADIRNLVKFGFFLCDAIQVKTIHLSHSLSLKMGLISSISFYGGTGIFVGFCWGSTRSFQSFPPVSIFQLFRSFGSAYSQMSISASAEKRSAGIKLLSQDSSRLISRNIGEQLIIRAM